MSMRWPFGSLIAVVATCAVVATTAWLANRPMFDKRLIGDLQALATRHAPALAAGQRVAAELDY